MIMACDSDTSRRGRLATSLIAYSSGARREASCAIMAGRLKGCLPYGDVDLCNLLRLPDPGASVPLPTPRFATFCAVEERPQRVSRRVLSGDRFYRRSRKFWTRSSWIFGIF